MNFYQYVQSFSPEENITPQQAHKVALAAMLEAERIAKDSSVKGYTNMDDLIADLEA